MNPARALRAANHELDTLVANTPEQRDRYVDFLRVFAIAVVVCWHWSLSILYWSGDRWVMPNPIHEVPGGWLATWPLQIVTVFFLVGGYANAAAWWTAQRNREGLAGYYRARLQRLLVPVVVFCAVWLVIEVVAHALVAGYSGVLTYGQILFTPLWFIAAYLWVVLLTPLTASLHAWHRWLTLGALAGLVLAADLGRFVGGLPALGWLNSALVWVFVHQLGYFLRDGAWHRLGRWAALGLAAVAVAALALLTSLEPYPRSMVATVGQERSNILPTTVPIALVALLQLGLIIILREPVTRWLRRRRVWKLVVAANAVILTIFLWHMTALLVVLAGLHAAGAELRREPTLAWWLERPFWLIAPALVLVVLVAIFGSFEWASRRWVRAATGAAGRLKAAGQRWVSR